MNSQDAVEDDPRPSDLCKDISLVIKTEMNIGGDLTPSPFCLSQKRISFPCRIANFA